MNLPHLYLKSTTVLIDKFEKPINVSVDKVTKAQKRSDEMFVKLEKRQPKFDE